MRLKAKTDYCIRVLIYLQENPGLVKIQTIADSYNISKNHLSIAVNQLSELKYVNSTQGPKGGIEFNPAVKNKPLGQLISLIEEIQIAECFDPKTNKCTITPHCRLKGMLSSASNAFIKELDRFQIQDLI